jgi:iron complex outermembrane receptor protein
MSKLQKIRAISRSSRALLMGSAALCLLSAANAAQAQSAPPAGEEVEQIVVTGSSIRGVAPVGSALIGVTKDTIALQAPADTKELLRNIPQLGNFGANAEQSTSNRFRTAGFQPNIHNLGIYATLTLINGHRIAPTGGEAVFPDPSIIPVIALQRVELVADGASSIYGSDAVAGVVNFIYRKPFNGIEAQATYGFNDTRYEKRDIAVIAGHTWDRGGIMAAYEYSANKSPLNTEIPVIARGGNQLEAGGRDLRGTVCLTPSIRSVDANGRASGATYQYPGLTSGADRCGVLNQQTIVPDGHRNAVLVTGDYQINDTVKAWAEVNYSMYKTTRFQGRQSLNIIVPRTNPFFVETPGTVGQSQEIAIRSGLGLFPAVVGKQSAELAALTLGLDINLGNDWKGTLMTHASRTRDYNDDPELDLTNAARLARNTTRDTAFNPFGQAADNNASVLAQINNGFTQTNKSSQRMRELQFKADGPVMEITGGTVRAALGVDVRQDQAIQLQTAGSRATGASFYNVVRNDDINRYVAAVFGELNVPLVGEANARPGVEALTLSVSGRYDYYQRLGGRVNPKYGVVYSPIKNLNVHASYGTNFAAPNMGLVTSIFSVPQYNSNQNLRVASGPYAGTLLGTINVLNIGGGNPELTPEKAKTYSLGFDYTPTIAMLDGLRFGATWYAVNYTNLIYKATQADVITDPAFEQYRIVFPTAAQVAETLRLYPAQQPVTAPFDFIFNSNAINIGARKFAGIDFDASYALRTDSAGVFNFAFNANRQTKYSQQVATGRAFTSQLGTFNAPKWKSTSRVTWNLDPFTVSLVANYVSSFRNTTITPNQKVKSNTVFDLTAAYKLPDFMGLKNASLQVRAQNLFDKNPPFYDNATGYFPALASPFGRTVDLTLRAAF